MSIRAVNSVVSALPSCRVALLLGGVLLISESVLLATTMFAASAITFVASLALAAKIYRAPSAPAADEAPSTWEAAGQTLTERLGVRRKKPSAQTRRRASVRPSQP